MINITRELSAEAERLMEARRRTAKSRADAHYAEVIKKIPQIEEINRRLTGTGLELFKIIMSNENPDATIDSLRKSNAEAQELIAKLLTTNGFPADYLDEKFACSECFDTGYKHGKHCECFKRLMQKLATERLNMESQVRLSSFSDFSMNFYRGDNENYKNMNGVLTYCMEYAQSFSLTSKSIFMLGQTGLGKTHLSLAIAAEVIRKGYNVAYDSIINFLRKIENEHFGRSEGDTLELLLASDLLIMDDLGSEFESSFYSSVIYNIINTRLNYSRPTIVSTNMSPQQLQQRYDDRIVSRLFAMYDYLKFTGNDVRQAKKRLGL